MVDKDKGFRYQLTIAIPTYNRLNKLMRTLSTVIGLCEGKPVEILVSDNCSVDGTEEYMRKMTVSYPWVGYYRNEENLGADRNFLNCLNKATGKYVMLLGDDDLLQEKGLETLLIAIEQEPVFIYCNSSGLVENSNGFLCVGEPLYKEEGLVYFNDRNELLKKMGIYVTFMSALVFRTEYVRMIPDQERYIGTYFMQSHLALSTMVHDGIYIFNSVCCCAAGGNKTVRYDLLNVWGKCYGDLMYKTAVQSGFDAAVVDEVTHHAYATNILQFVWDFRWTCKNEKEWDRDAMWFYVNRYPDLKRKYKVALSCPRGILAVRRFSSCVASRFGKIKKIFGKN